MCILSGWGRLFGKCNHQIWYKKSQAKIKAIVEAPEPTNLTETRSFLGLVRYYHKFILNAAEILYPIYDLLEKNKKFVCSLQYRKAFKETKNLVVSGNCLIHFDLNLAIIVTTDASDHGIGGVLSQIVYGKEKNCDMCV